MRDEKTISPRNNGRRAGLRRLAVWTSAIAVVWLVVLPWLARQPAVDARLQWLDAQGIDPSAMYYTELESMQPILQDLNERFRAQQKNPHRQHWASDVDSNLWVKRD